MLEQRTGETMSRREPIVPTITDVFDAERRFYEQHPSFHSALDLENVAKGKGLRAITADIVHIADMVTEMLINKRAEGRLEALEHVLPLFREAITSSTLQESLRSNIHIIVERLGVFMKNRESELTKEEINSPKHDLIGLRDMRDAYSGLLAR